MPRPDYGDEFEAEEGADDRTGGRRRIDLSVAQVAGAGVATLTAATAASYLNVYGTVIGTAVMAVLSTSAAPVIQHWITRSGEQAKGLAEKASKQPGVKGFVASASAVSAAEAMLDPDTARTGERGSDTDPYGFPAGHGDPDDATRTMAMPVVGLNLPGQTIAHGFGNPEDATAADGPAAPGATEPMPRTGGEGALRYPGGAQDDDEAEDPQAPSRPRRGWRTAAVSAAAVFTLVMLVILLFELLTGRSLTAWTQGRAEPTSPSLLGGTSAPAQVEEEGPDTSGGGPGQQEQGPGTREPGVEEPVQPQPGTTPGEQRPEVPGGPQNPPDPPVEEEHPEGQEDGGVPGPEGGAEGEAPPEAVPAPTG